ncbi:MAG TPA: hypothetical protein VEL31_28090 [Ktedonobacteraceae bacterium]|nr:hypothetical protein [Ktedonobacteraceae bacterium]
MAALNGAQRHRIDRFVRHAGRHCTCVAIENLDQKTSLLTT